MNGHISSLADVLAISKELAHKVFKRKASLLKHARLPVLGEYHIFGAQS